MKYHKIFKIYKEELSRLDKVFTPKQAKAVGLNQYILTKMRHRGILERKQVKDGIFEWRKVII